MPILSIIVPIYKVEPYLRQCIESILRQTWEEFELILIDDGSPDKCGEICDEYHNKDGRVKVIHQENKGLSIARNIGLEVAQGKYLAFVDSDDWLDPDMYKTLIILAEAYNADIAECGYVKVFADGQRENIHFSHSIKLVDNITALKEFKQEKCWHVVIWNKIYRSYLWDGVQFPPGKVHEDEYTTYKLYYKADRIVQLDAAFINYRQRPDSIMGKGVTPHRYLDALEAFNEKEEFFRNEKIKELQDLACVELLEYLMYAWLEIKKQKKVQKGTLDIKRKFNKAFRILLQKTHLSLKKRMVFSLFYLSPSLYALNLKYNIAGRLKHNKILPELFKRFACRKTEPNIRQRLGSIIKSKNLYLFLVPLHGNLGDQAIIYAENKLAEDLFPDYNVIEILQRDTKSSVKALKKGIKRDDLICLIGGGNMGDEYPGEEQARRYIIKHFPHNRIVSFPQTIYFSATEQGSRELNKSRKVYEKNKNLTLIAREQVSYKIMQKEFPETSVLLMPDIVFYLNQAKADRERQGVLCCLRSDREGAIRLEQKLVLLAGLQQRYPDLTVTDTVIGREVDIDNRERELNEIWEAFRTSKVVITDRLHGMIFAAITATPCVVLSNYNHKVQSSYQWLQDVEYIRFIQDFDPETVLQQVDELSQLDIRQLLPCDLTDKFKEIMACLTVI